MGSSAAELTRGNAALGALVAQLDRLAGVPLAHGGSCEHPCLDLGQYEALHSRACICMQQSFARLERLAGEAARRSAWAIAGMLHPSYMRSLAPSQLCRRRGWHACDLDEGRACRGSSAGAVPGRAAGCGHVLAGHEKSQRKTSGQCGNLRAAADDMHRHRDR